MRRGWMWMGLGLVLGLGGWAVLGAELDPEVRKLMEKYERQAAPPAPKSAPAPKPKPKPKPPPVGVESAPALEPGLAPELVRLPGGCFQMGSPENEPDRGSSERRHRVCVKAFEMGRYEVTQRQWQAVMGNNPSSFKGCADCPVEEVSLIDVQDYLAKLNGRTGGNYRLPTEAEWEYACRGGVAGQRYCGGDDEDRVAWYDGNSSGKTHPVGQKAANGFGLYDMSGNVQEWTCSLYDANYGGAELKCSNKNTPGVRSWRGGYWSSDPEWVRSASRLGGFPTFRGLAFDLGFRLARSL